VVFLSACLAMGVYIAFDVLDLDGSNMRGVGPGTAFAAESPSAEADRLLPQRPVSPATQGVLPLRPDFRIIAERLRPRPHDSRDAAHARPGAMRPRAHLARVASPANSPTGDPA
jgi:hypothetical protein